MVLVRSAPRGSEVAVCCQKAAAEGVRPGMPLVEAQALARGLSVAKYDPEGDRRALVKCAEACERFSPRVAIEEVAEPESLLLDVGNLEHLWGSEARLVGQVKKFFTRRGYLVRLGVADTVGAAWAATHFDEALTNNMEGAGESSKHSSFILPVESLRISEEAAGLLQELGIETVDQLKALPREGLVSRFGEKLLLRLDQLTGAGRELIEPRRPSAALEASHVLEEPTADRTVLLYVFEQLVEQLAGQLTSRDQGAVLLIGSFCSAGCTPQQFEVGLLQPSANARQLLELIELHLERVQLRSEVDRIELRAAVVGRLGERQGELFADCWPTDPHQLAVLVNRLGSRLGYESVLRAEPRASPVPERAVKWTAVLGKNKQALKQVTKRGHSSPQSSSVSIPARPLVLCSKPQAIEVEGVAPDGPPQFVWLEKRREQVIRCVGPERIETLWWRGPTVRRDYYRVTTESSRHFWIFERLVDQRWFLHGIFE